MLVSVDATSLGIVRRIESIAVRAPGRSLSTFQIGASTVIDKCTQPYDSLFPWHFEAVTGQSRVLDLDVRANGRPETLISLHGKICRHVPDMEFASRRLLLATAVTWCKTCCVTLWRLEALAVAASCCCHGASDGHAKMKLVCLRCSKTTSNASCRRDRCKCWSRHEKLGVFDGASCRFDCTEAWPATRRHGSFLSRSLPVMTRSESQQLPKRPVRFIG